MLKPEFVDLLQLDVLGFDNPEDALHAFSNAQNELCQPGFSPNETFEVNLNILQCITRDASPQINDNQSTQIVNALLNHLASNRIPDRVVTFNYRSGHKMVESNTFIDCDLVVANCTVLSFTHAALCLGSHLAISVLFARLN